MCDRRLRRAERITEEYEYKAVVTKGKPISAKSLKAYFLIDSGLERKAGFIAGKVAGDACHRNRAKRLLREAYRRLKCEVKPSGFKVVFIARTTTAGATADQISMEMRRMFQRCGLLKH